LKLLSLTFDNSARGLTIENEDIVSYNCFI